MDQSNSNTIEGSRKLGHHLTLDERGMIQALHEQGYSLRGIAAAVGCAHTTVHYELRRGTPVLVKHFCNSTTYIFKNDIELHKESDNYCMNVACHGCTSHRQILQ